MRTLGAIPIALLLLATNCLADEPHDRAFLRAAYNGNTATMQAEIDAGANINREFDDQQGSFPINALMASVAGRAPSALKFVLEKSAFQRSNKLLALIAAIQFEDDTAVKLLVDDIKPLTASDPALVRMLAERMAEPLATALQDLLRMGIFQETPPSGMGDFDWGLLSRGRFSKAADDHAIVILNTLVDAGADINSSSPSLTISVDITGLVAAARAGDRYLVQAFLNRGATLPAGWTQADLTQVLLVGASRNGNLNAIAQLLAAGVNPSSRSKFDDYGLAEATVNSHLDVVDKLLAAGADPNAWGKDQFSPLVGAVRSGNPSILASLLKAGATTSNKHDTRGWPLRTAVRRAARSLVQLLIEAGAPLTDRDTQGRTVLHDFTLSEYALESSASGTRKLRAEDIEIVKYLGSKGFDFSATDSQGRSIISSSLDWEGTDLVLLKTFVENHASVTTEALRRAIQINNVEALKIMVRSGADLSAPAILSDAFWKLSQMPEMSLILLQAGAALPTSDYTVNSAFIEASSIGATELVASLLSRGVAPNTANYSQSALSAAVVRGHADIAKLLFEKGADPKSFDRAGGTVFHDLVRSDIANRSDSPALGDGQQHAIAEMITAGFNATSKDKNGRSALELATGYPETLSRATTAIGLSASTQSKVHEAVRNDDLKALSTLQSGGADLNVLDSLGRSPLTIALQLKRYAIADYLMAAGVNFTLEARNGFQGADVDFASDDRLAQAFMLRLLRSQLLDLGPNAAATNPTVSIKKFDDNLSMRPPDAVWTIPCEPCQGTITLHGNNKASLPIDSTRTDGDRSTSYGTRQMAITPITVTGPINFELIFTVNFALTIPGCSFDFASDPTCFPQVDIKNPNEPSSLMVQTWKGLVPLFPTTIIHAQQGSNSWAVNPGEKVTLDRSKGAIQLSIEPVVSKVFALGVDVFYSTGPTIPQPSSLAQTERAKTYAQLAKWKAQFENSAAGGGSNIELQAKALATSRHVLSARAVERNYPSHVRDALRARATDVAALDARTLELRDAILSQSELTVGDIDLLIARVDALMSGAPASTIGILQQIRDQLVAARGTLQSTGDRLSVFSERFFTEIDRIVRDYQSLILELAQYIPPSELNNVLTAPVRSQIAGRLKASNTVIYDEALGGRGAAIRAAFGLPSPRNSAL